MVLGWALQIDIPFSFCIILYPLVGTFAAIPISLNGIGLREGGYLFMLGLIGINAEKGVAFGLLLFLVVVVDSLIGGGLFLLKKSPKASADALCRSQFNPGSRGISWRDLRNERKPKASVRPVTMMPAPMAGSNFERL